MIPLSLQDISFAQPWAFGVVVLTLVSPLLLRALTYGVSRHEAKAENSFVSPHMARKLSDEGPASARFRHYASILYWVSAVLLAFALTRPQWGEIQETIQQRGLDILIAIDLSTSMRAQDVSPSRIDNARQELAFLVDELKGDRIGLIGFAGSAFLFCPLTLDTDSVELFLDEMTVEAVPVPGTALGEAIRTALASFTLANKDKGNGSQVLLLLTDGEDAQSDPLGAAKEAAQAGVIIDTIGLGTLQGGQIPDPQTGGLILNERGQPVTSKLDGKTLAEIAKLTGGEFLRLETSKDGLTSYLRILKQRQTRLLGDKINVRRQERFILFLIVSGLAFLGALTFEEVDKRR